jgi:hypothetical protein
LLVQERKNSEELKKLLTLEKVKVEKLDQELKKLLTLEKVKVEKLDQELAKTKETTYSLKSSISAL